MKFINDNNHIILELDGVKCLVDTGCPTSFSIDIDRTITIRGKSYSLTTNRMNNSVKRALDAMVRTKVDAFIGNDILKNGFTVNYNTHEFEFYSTPGQIIYLINNNTSYLSTGDATINDKPSRNTIIDSGACISYLARPLLEGAVNTCEVFEDYNPQLGKIVTDIYEVTLQAWPLKMIIRVGVMPLALEKAGFTAFLALKDISSTGIVSFDGKALFQV